MPTLNVASIEGATVEQSPGKLTSASGPINIASVRATSLRTSGLRAASSRRATDAQKENKSAVSALGTETRMSANQLSCLSSSVSMSSSSHLSYTDSQEPGEDSQLNAFAMVDKLVNLNASLMWQQPESSIVADQSCMKGPQSNKGLQSLAHNAQMKNLQDKMGIYDWIDSQPDANGDLEQVSPTFKGQQKQLEACMPTKSRKVWQGMMTDLPLANDTTNALVKAKEAYSVKQQNTESNLCQSFCVGAPPLKSMQKLGVSSVVPNELHDTDARYDTDASYDKGDTEIMDIGANTQIALEAMDIMRCGILLNNGSAPHNEKATSALLDIGNDTQNAIDAIDIMLNNESTPHYEKATSSLLDIGNDTQMAIDAMDIMRHGIKKDKVLSKVKATSSLFGIGYDTQTAVLPKVKVMSSLFDIGNDTQTAIDAIDILSKVGRQEEIERGSRVQNSSRHVKKHASRDDLDAKRKLSQVPSTLGRRAGLLSKSPTDEKPVGKKVSFRGASTNLKSQGDALFNPAGPVYNSRKRFLLNFSSAMVPRRKRSRLCAPRGTLNENVTVFGWQKHDFHPHKPVTQADKQAQPGKTTSFVLRKSALWPKKDGNSPEVAVLTESTNGRRTKKETSTKSDCYTLMEQSRKRRKCEPRCIFVLFSHSLSEAIMKQQKKMLTKLGGHVATSAAKATHFIADTFVRSRNMLEIMAAGKVVVTTMWLEGCIQAEYFVDEKSYILQDVQKEKQWGFCMHSSLAASRRKPLFKGMKVMVSPTTSPDFEAIKAMIESAGGQALRKLSKADEISSVSFLVASEKEYDFCVEFLKKGCKVYSTELILHGIVTQNLDLSRHRLFEDYIL